MFTEFLWESINSVEIILIIINKFNNLNLLQVCSFIKRLTATFEYSKTGHNKFIQTNIYILRKTKISFCNLRVTNTKANGEIIL